MVKDYYRHRWDVWLTGMAEGRSAATVVATIAEFEQQWYKVRSPPARVRDTGAEHTVVETTVLEMAASLLQHYVTLPADELHQHYDAVEGVAMSHANDVLHQCWTHNVAVLARFCSDDIECGGFTNTGWLFTLGAVLTPIQTLQPAPAAAAAAKTTATQSADVAAAVVPIVAYVKRHASQVVVAHDNGANSGADDVSWPVLLIGAAAVAGLIYYVVRCQRRKHGVQRKVIELKDL